MKMLELDPFDRLENGVTFGRELPAQHFFEPLPALWPFLKVLEDVNFIDCGAGMGHVMQQSKLQGLRMLSVDKAQRPGQHPEVMPINALTIDYWSPTIWPIFFRPDHSGWVEKTILNAHKRGAVALYVGLARNYQRDILSFRNTCLHVEVGKQQECIYVLPPPQKSCGKALATEAATRLLPLLNMGLRQRVRRQVDLYGG